MVDKELHLRGSRLIRIGKLKKGKSALEKLAPDGLIARLIELLDTTSPEIAVALWKELKDKAVSFEEFLVVTNSEHLKTYSSIVNRVRRKISIFIS